MGLICGSLIGFGVLVQVDYVRAWRSQQQFWTVLLPLISDAGPGDAILIEPGIFLSSTIFDTNHIDANTWNVPRVLNQLYDYPFEYSDLPRVFRLRIGWDATIVNADGSLHLGDRTVFAPPSLYTDVSPLHVIFIQNNNGRMERVTDYFTIIRLNGYVVHVKSPDMQTVMPYPKGFLYKSMILSKP